MTVLRCKHTWGFPRRREEFGDHRNIDVQTCSKCAAERISPVQFGPAPKAQFLEAQG